MDAQEKATLLRDVVSDSVLRSSELTGDQESFVIAVCVGRNGESEYTNVTCTNDAVGIVETVMLMLKALDKMLPKDKAFQLVVGDEIVTRDKP